MNTSLKMNPMKRFCERLKEARIAAGFSSQDKFATAIGMIRTNYQPYEKGKKLPAREVIPRMAVVLGLRDTTMYAWLALEEFSYDDLMEANRILEGK